MPICMCCGGTVIDDECITCGQDYYETEIDELPADEDEDE
ncbi:hypothetical protein LCGC14_0392200 [marine sediment metagenome]|uniref:Uncharacterized protein n=1 Tax=marine sediment metagenome TaxID=412755 RepID=A0A0F9VLD5_9ZZZZ